MNVRVESLCQADGKIYVQVAIERMNPSSIITLDAHLKDGTIIPSHLLSFDPLDDRSSANYTVIIPHLDEREIEFEFHEYFKANEPIGHSHIAIETNMLNLRTRINSVMRNELVAQMLDIEREYCSDRMNTYFTAAIEDEDEIVVKMLVDMPQTEGTDVKVRFLDAHGKERDLPVYPLFEEVVPPHHFGEVSRLHVGFSVRVPRENKDFCVNARDDLGAVPGGFAMFCDETYEPLTFLFEAETGDAAHYPDYSAWYLSHSATLADLAEQRRLSFSIEPLITLVMPLSRGDGSLLGQTLQAIGSQTYKKVELVVVDHYYEDAEFDALASNFEGLESVIHVKVDRDLSAADSFEAGLGQAHGKYVALLNPEIVLAPEALFEVVRTINESFAYPDQKPASIIYSHHDTIHKDGTLSDLKCKPAYSPDLLNSYNYVGPFIVFERSLIDHVREVSSIVSDALLYDLLFKTYEICESMHRIDQVLYHVQDIQPAIVEVDVARIEAKEVDFRGGRRAVANHLKRLGIEATVLSDAQEQAYHCNYFLPKDLPSVIAIVVNHDQPYHLETCLNSFFAKNTYEKLALCVVDNGSEHDQTREVYETMCRRYKQVHVVRNEERKSYAACINDVMSDSLSDYVLLLDTNVEVLTDDMLVKMLGLCQRKDVAVVGAKLLHTDDTVAQAGRSVGSSRGDTALFANLPRGASGYLKRLACTNNVSAVSKACQLFKRSVFNEVGGYDERFKLDFSDTDFCLKVLKAGYLVVYEPEVELYHFENTIQDQHLSDERRIRLEQERAYLHFRWPRAFVEGDPFSSSLLVPGSGYYQLYH